MWLWTLSTAPYITQYIHSALVNNITTVLHTHVLRSIHMYCISCCNEAVEGPESRFSFYSFCLLLCFLSSFLYSFIYLQFYVFLCFSNSTFLPFHPSSLIFLRLYIFFNLFLSGSLLSLILESLYPSIIYQFIHPSFFLPFYLQSFLRTFSLFCLFPFFLSFVPRFILCRPNLRQLLVEYEETAPCLQECFRVHVSSVITENFLGLIMPVSCCIHSHSIFFQRNTKCQNLPSLIMQF
jgi:hypothetical protein